MGKPAYVLHRIMQYVSKHNYSDAIEMGEKAIADHPDNAKIRFHVARAYHSLGETSKALEHLHYIENEIDKNDVYMLQRLAKISLENNDSETAVGYLRRELEQTPDNKIPMSILFNAYLAQKDFKSAQTLGERLLNFPDGGKDPQILVGMIRLSLAERKAEEAEDYMEMLKCLPGQKNHPHTQSLEVRICLAQGDHDNAKKVVNKLLKKDPDNDVGMVLKGRIAISEGDFDTARKMARQLSREPFHPTNMLFMRYVAACGDEKDRKWYDGFFTLAQQAGLMNNPEKFLLPEDDVELGDMLRNQLLEDVDESVVSGVVHSGSKKASARRR